MKKRILCITFAIVMLLSLSTNVFAVQNDISIVIDNQKVEFTANSGKPFIDKNGRTQVPLRAVLEQYGCKVEWDGTINAAVATKGSNKVVVPIGQPYILVNGKSIATDTAALVQNGRTYLPIRPVLEAFGANVEWENGKVNVTSPANSGFENIYIDKSGNLIFELSNGNKINAGKVSNGKNGSNGSDGISIVNAYVDGSGNLMISLSSGRTINAGNIGVGGNMNGLTFADYAVGTKFYLTHPTGAFSVTVYPQNVPHTVNFTNVYYELTEKRDISDADAWFSDKDGTTDFIPYEVTMHISGQTDTSLAGSEIKVTFADVVSGSWEYTSKIATDGTFEVSYAQGFNSNPIWYSPKTLMLKTVSVWKNSIEPAPDVPEPPEDFSNLIANLAGDWVSSPDNPNDIITLKEDGTLIYEGVEYTPDYKYLNPSQIQKLRATIEKNGESIRFDFFIDYNELDVDNKPYWKERTWDTIILTPENWLDYYELKSSNEFKYDAFGDFDIVEIDTYYELKQEYAERLDSYLTKSVDIKYSCTGNYADYTVDPSNQTISWSEPSRSKHYEETSSGIKRMRLLTPRLYDTNGKGWYYTYDEIIKVSGTLYLINN